MYMYICICKYIYIYICIRLGAPPASFACAFFSSRSSLFAVEERRADVGTGGE